MPGEVKTCAFFSSMVGPTLGRPGMEKKNMEKRCFQYKLLRLLVKKVLDFLAGESSPYKRCQ